MENVRRRFAPAVGGGILQGYDTLKTYRCQDLLNDVSLLPKQALAMIQDYPVKEGCSSVNLTAVSQPVSRSDVENGLVKVADLDDLDEVSALPWMFAWHRDYRVFWPGLDARHWLFTYLVDLNRPAITVESVIFIIAAFRICLTLFDIQLRTSAKNYLLSWVLQ